MSLRFSLAAVLALVVLTGGLGAAPAAAQPQGEVTYAMHVTIAPAWFDPAENTGIATPFMVQEALHNALVKPMPQNPMAPSLAQSWTESRARGSLQRTENSEPGGHRPASPSVPWPSRRLSRRQSTG